MNKENTKEAARAFGILRQKHSRTRFARAASMERNILIPPIKEKFRNIDVQACCGTQNAPLNADRSPAWHGSRGLVAQGPHIYISEFHTRLYEQTMLF